MGREQLDLRASLTLCEGQKGSRGGSWPPADKVGGGGGSKAEGTPWSPSVCQWRPSGLSILGSASLGAAPGTSGLRAHMEVDPCHPQASPHPMPSSHGTSLRAPALTAQAS